MSEPDLNAIRSAAEAATKGKWQILPDDTGCTLSSTDDCDGMLGSMFYAVDATYIATMDPQTTLALIARAENAEQERDAAVAALQEADGALWTLRGIAFDQIQADFDGGSAQAWWAYIDATRRLTRKLLAGSDKGEG